MTELLEALPNGPRVCRCRWVQILLSLDPISHLSFLSAFKTARDTNGVHEGFALPLLHSFMEHPAAAAVNASIISKLESHKREKIGTEWLHCEIVNYLLEMHTRDDVIAGTDVDMVQFT